MRSITRNLVPCRTGVAGRISRLITLIELAFQVRRERRMLSGMDDRALSDIGFDRATAHAEAERPLWDIPADRACRLPRHTGD